MRIYGVISEVKNIFSLVIVFPLCIILFIYFIIKLCKNERRSSNVSNLDECLQNAREKLQNQYNQQISAIKNETEKNVVVMDQVVSKRRSGKNCSLKKNNSEKDYKPLMGKSNVCTYRPSRFGRNYGG